MTGLPLHLLRALRWERVGLQLGWMNEFTPLPRSFYEPSASEVAPALLGHWLMRRTPEGLFGGPIVETEAYLQDDPACHAAPGLTARNRVMFGEPGHAYVYFIYGCHYCVNAVCRPVGEAEAVLIRAIEPLLGIEFLRSRRATALTRNLTNGPAKLCEAMAIGRVLNGTDLCELGGALMIARNDRVEKFRRLQGPTVTTTRIGINKAAHLPLRFYLKASPWVSRPLKE